MTVHNHDAPLLSEDEYSPELDACASRIIDLPCGCQDIAYACGFVSREHDHVDCDGTAGDSPAMDDYLLAQACYNGYIRSSDGKSLVTGDELPSFENLPEDIKQAWAEAAREALRESGRPVE